MDWHFAVGGLVLSLEDVRKREYKTPLGDLFMRPVQLFPVEGGWQSWQTVSSLIKNFRDDWGDKRNKVMKLREVLREGANAVAHFRKVYRTNGNPTELPTASGLHAPDGWHDGRCIHFDAIEAMEFFVDLA